MICIGRTFIQNWDLLVILQSVRLDKCGSEVLFGHFLREFMSLSKIAVAPGLFPYVFQSLK